MRKSEEREVFEIYAVKYAHNGNRTRNGNMLYNDEHDRPMPLDYFVWVIKNDKRTYVVDTGFGEVASKKRAAPLLRVMMLTGRWGTRAPNWGSVEIA